MNKSHLIGAAHAAVLALIAVSANAAFFGRLETFQGSGIYQAYYDDQLDITWAADGKLAMTRGDDDNGRMNWADAKTWAAGLVIGGAGGWRLPNMDINGDAAIVDCASVTQAACKDNEYGHFYNYGAGTQPGGGITPTSPGPFINVLQSIYWSGTEADNNAWVIGFLDGNQIESGKFNNHFMWAVRSGDVPAAPDADIDVTGVADISGDGVPDVAVLSQNSWGGERPRVHYYSGADGQKFNMVPYMNDAWLAVAAATVADGNQDSVRDDPAVAVLGFNIQSNKLVVQVRPANGGTPVLGIGFLSARWSPVDVVVIDDANGDGVSNDTAIGVLGINPNRSSRQRNLLQVRRLNDPKTVFKNVYFANVAWQPLAAGAVHRSGASPLLAMLAENPGSGQILVQARLLSDASFKRNTYFLSDRWWARDLAILHDTNGNSVFNDASYMVLAVNPGNGKNVVQIRRPGGALVKNISVLNANWRARRIARSDDISGNQFEELGVLGNKIGTVDAIIQLKDFATEDITGRIRP